MAKVSRELVLNGLNGSNPLAFLCALGTLITSSKHHERASLHWIQDDGGWKPLLGNCGNDPSEFVENLHETLVSLPSEPFLIEKRLPFSAASMRKHMEAAAAAANPDDRRTADFLASYGSDALRDRDGTHFQDTLFCMVRSGDSKGQGLLHYAFELRKRTTKESLTRTLFSDWDYKDYGYSSLRWDPIEDQRYALRWRNPQQDKVGTMLGANSLALEALRSFPAIPSGNKLHTTGFTRAKPGTVFFSWPIWDAPIGIETIRSLVSMPSLQVKSPRREKLRARGIVEVYRSERIAPNQYYRNFSPAMSA